ncbi:F-type H+-transporting ATPase subunit delta [Roseimicrobium gellanilyticum]|uniref:F-type H+-transporting ATPase subunit delta n=1 Tax=Roseimicrobium gellanilyticum TaxID=748857 RepID=A0A366H5K1_9BACT|nr:F0F1 ATP synthase subunit delta [Roseimicrobium gellanilyticum]RBP37347.1 F-type H+-transporting ATPase subunit delta [Roseimicrobium gellanilyticum]
MKIDKNSARAARQLMRACVDKNGRLQQPRVRAVVKRLAEEKPRGYLRILAGFERLLRLEVEKRHALIESASPLSSTLRDKIRADLQAKFGTDLEFDFAEKPELLGGLRVQVGSHVWDGSVLAKLESLRNSLS